jgi:hypothetical protein
MPMSTVAASAIDHGLSFFDEKGADRDVPMGPLAYHWIGLKQKPTPRPARGGRNEEAAGRTKGGPVKMEPKVSKAYVAELRKRLEGSRAEFSDKEWPGLMVRLQMLEDAAPDKIDGELPMEEMA